MPEGNIPKNQPMPKHTILFIIDALGIGGTERQLILTAHALRKRFNVAILCLSRTPPAKTLPYPGLKVAFVKYSDSPKVYFKRIVSHIRTLSPTVVQSMLGTSVRIGTLAAAFAHVPAIITQRGTAEITEEMKTVLTYTRISNRVSDAIIACSHAVKQTIIHFEKVSADKIATIYNCVDVKTINRRSKHRPSFMCGLLRKKTRRHIVGIVSRLTPRKGHVHFLCAAKEVLGVFPDTHFFVVGDGPAKRDLSSLACKLGISGQVHFLGARNDIPELIGAFDVCVFTSFYEEGCPNVILEYMAARKAIVATKVGGVSELLSHGKTGLLIPPEDRKRLSQAILRLLRNPRLRMRLGVSAYRHVKDNFSVNRKIECLSALYTSILKKKMRELRGIHRKPLLSLSGRSSPA
jgi:glycosyltransferase involved in cell wall biosynthesis